MARLNLNSRAKNFRTLIILAIVVVLGAFVAIRIKDSVNAGPDARVGLAQCLTEKGTKMYGAYWCPHCQAQKKLFGKAFKDVTYIECAVPGNNAAQTKECQDMDIKGYPTWIFPDGTRVTGEQTFSTLADKSGCTYDETPEADAGAVTY